MKFKYCDKLGLTRNRINRKFNIRFFAWLAEQVVVLIFVNQSENFKMSLFCELFDIFLSRQKHKMKIHLKK